MPYQPLSPEKQGEVRRRPESPVAWWQSWRNLCFLHYPVEPEIIAATLPKGLEVDVWPDATGRPMAWIGIVAFGMEGIRSPLVPAFPWLGAFLETNVRTYVHRSGEEPGVWFYSLDAQRRIACEVARTTFGLPYFHADMSVEQAGVEVDYRVRRYDEPHAELRLRYAIGEPLPTPGPGSFEFWLVERYLLYAQTATGTRIGRVWHEPYPLLKVDRFTLDQSLTDALGFPSGKIAHVAFSPGVDVEVFALEPAR